MSFRNADLSPTHRERLPWPLAWLWVQAQRAQRPDDVHRAAEGVLRVMDALLLADCLDLAWPKELGKLLGTLRGPNGAPLAAAHITMGRRVDILALLAPVHADAPDRVLGDVAGWLQRANGPNGPLRPLINVRNDYTHRAAVMPDSKAIRDGIGEALAHLAEVLRAPWLSTVQLVHLDGDVVPRHGRLEGRIRRLAGAAPHVPNASDTSWPREAAFETNRLYMGRADGTLWRVCWSLEHVATTPSPRVHILDGVVKDGLAAWNPDSSDTSATLTLRDAGGESIGWRAFADRREELARTWKFSIEAPHPTLAMARPNDLLGSLAEGHIVEGVQLKAPLGEGGWGVVWEGLHLAQGQRWAYKVFKGDPTGPDAERFEQEAETMQRLRRDGCKRILAPVELFHWRDGEGRRPVLRMPLMEGSLLDLAEIVRAGYGRRPDDATLLEWLDACLIALDEIHGLGVVHRDIKLANFLVDDQGGIVLSDLGVARDEGVPRRTLTGHSEVLGTRDYMAPEQRTRPRAVGPPADIYALAVSFDELWRDGPHDTVPAPVSGLLHDMTALEPNDRPRAHQASARVRALLESFDPDRATAPRKKAPRPTPPQRRADTPLPTRTLLGAAVLVVTLAGALAWLTRTPGPAATPQLRLVLDERDVAVGPAGDPQITVPRGAIRKEPVVQVKDALGTVHGEVAVQCSPMQRDFVREDGTLDTREDGTHSIRCWAGDLNLVYHVVVGAETDAPPAGSETRAAGTTTYEMVRLPAGTFTMGLPLRPLGLAPGTDLTDGTTTTAKGDVAHKVTLTTGLWLGVTEVDQALWTSVMGSNPSRKTYQKTGVEVELRGDTLPVQMVDWCAATTFANRLSERDGYAPAYTIPRGPCAEIAARITWNRAADGYRLPTEAEWEYAAHAGDPRSRFSGARAGDPDAATAGARIDEAPCRVANIADDLAARAWPQENYRAVHCDDHYLGPSPVGAKDRNAWGLADLSGNVWEWVWDAAAAYPVSATDPTGGTNRALERLIRGGAWSYSAWNAHITNRRAQWPSDAAIDVGLRLARNADAP